ncbi:heme-binding protein 2-like [Pelodytes ibericus]
MGVRSLIVLGLLSLYSSVALAEDYPVYQAPSFCGKSECPKYELVKDYKTFELRSYEPTQWVSTSLDMDLIGIGMVTSFRRLFKYISGSNTESLKINMTVPVILSVPLNDDSVNATMSFFLALENPPRPLDPNVYLEKYGQQSVYVKSFGGYAFDYEYAKKAKALSEELVALGIPFEDSFYERVGYNSPFTLFNRHNEVWYLAK